MGTGVRVGKTNSNAIVKGRVSPENSDTVLQEMSHTTAVHRAPQCPSKIQPVVSGNIRRTPTARRPQRRHSRPLAADSKGKTRRASHPTNKTAHGRAGRSLKLDVSKSADVPAGVPADAAHASAAMDEGDNTAFSPPMQSCGAASQLQPGNPPAHDRKANSTCEAAPISPQCASMPGAVVSLTRKLSLTSANGDAAVRNVKIGSESSDDNGASRKEMSRRGLSVHAAPFVPRSSTCCRPPPLASATCEHGASLFPCDARKRCAEGTTSPVSTGNADRRLLSGEFPCTPMLVPAGVLFQPSALRGGGAAVTPEVCLSPDASIGGCVSPLTRGTVVSSARFPSSDIAQPQAVVRYGDGRDDSVEATPYPTEGCGESCESDGVRHLRVRITDAEAQDEAKMFHMLQVSDGEGEEDAALFSREWQERPLASSNTGASNVELFHCGGGYWDVNGPTVATHRLLRHCVLSSSSLNVELEGDDLPATFASENESAPNSHYLACENDEEESWEMSSSAYDESLDDEQMRWIEQLICAEEGGKT